MPNSLIQQRTGPRWTFGRHAHGRRGPRRTLIEAFALLTCAVIIAVELIS